MFSRRWASDTTGLMVVLLPTIFIFFSLPARWHSGWLTDAPWPAPEEIHRVFRVVDGDTIRVEGVGYVRLVGVNTPEVVDPRHPGPHPCGPEASSFLKHLLPAGSWVRLEDDSPDGPHLDVFGRRLAYVWHGPTLVNAKIITEGWSAAYTKYHFREDRKILFLRLEGEAHAKRLGMWGRNDCQP